MPDEPIQLPSLSLDARGPTAAVCTRGHVLSWFVDPTLVPKFCPKCGARVLVACPACDAVLPADGEMLQWVPYHPHCMHCGAAYPWIADEVARAKRTLAEQGEVDRWSDDVKARADELVDDIAGDRVTSSGVGAALSWLTLHGGGGGSAAIVDAVERFGSLDLKQALRANFPEQF